MIVDLCYSEFASAYQLIVDRQIATGSCRSVGLANRDVVDDCYHVLKFEILARVCDDC